MHACHVLTHTDVDTDDARFMDEYTIALFRSHLDYLN